MENLLSDSRIQRNFMVQHFYSCQTDTLHFEFEAAVAATGL